MDNAIIAGIVPRNAETITAWGKLRDYLRSKGEQFDFVSFSSYARQVDFLLRGRIDIALNTPIAHLRVQEKTRGESISLCMRDSDRDIRSILVVREDARIRDLNDLAGKRVAVGGADAGIGLTLPLHFFKKAGVDPGRVEFLSFTADEDLVFDALLDCKAEAAIVTSSSWERRKAERPTTDVRIKPLWSTPPFDYCVFDAVPPLWSEQIGSYMQALENIKRKLFEMTWEASDQRQILRLLGQKKWMPAREDGYDSLREALKEERAKHGSWQHTTLS